MSTALAIFQTIALLCRVDAGDVSVWSDEYQLRCQKQYLICVQDKHVLDDTYKLMQCIMDRKVK